MKVLVLLCLVVFCYSQPAYIGKHVSLSQDGVISVVGNDGREVDIFKSVTHPGRVDIVLRSPYGPTRRIEVDQANNIRNDDHNTVYPKFWAAWQYLKQHPEVFTQHDILLHLFHDYEGMVTDQQYENLLKEIHQLINIEVLGRPIGDVLRYLDNQYYTLEHQQWESDYPQNSLQEQEYGLRNQYSQSSMNAYQRFQDDLQHRNYQQQEQEYYPVQYEHRPYGEYQYQYGHYEMNPWFEFFNRLNQQRRASGQQVYGPRQYYQWQHQYYPDQYRYQREYPEYFEQGYSLYPQQYYQQYQEQYKINPWAKFVWNLYQQNLQRGHQGYYPQFRSYPWQWHQQQGYYPYHLNQMN